MIGQCWEVGTWRDRPRPITVIKDTGKMIVIEIETYAGKKIQRRQAKITSDTEILQTWDEAKAWLINEAENKLTSAKRSLDQARSKLELMKALKP